MLFIFDVDGTLTPSRQKINQSFHDWILNDFGHRFVIITGSDPSKTREQIGNVLYESTVVYNCSGNHIFDRGVEVYRSQWILPFEIEKFLLKELNNTDWTEKTGNHIEHRVGLCNFSIVGRNANKLQREKYKHYDDIKNERFLLAEKIMKNFKGIETGVAGETGIDIYEKGTGKDRLLTLLPHNETLIFFGDKQDYPGNDYSLARDILKSNRGICHNVSGWEETMMILKDYK